MEPVTASATAAARERIIRVEPRCSGDMVTPWEVGVCHRRGATYWKVMKVGTSHKSSDGKK
ncbi:hypothetical protein GCM10009680_57960 [Streptomyces yatensis]|uniref:Uncharacterized protein n=1 Tax=Streptomyces yatensis TaxID=155177 RepID=A0ABP4USW8_9ACTN